jgi:hypothetical protein
VEFPRLFVLAHLGPDWIYIFGSRVGTGSINRGCHSG